VKQFGTEYIRLTCSDDVVLKFQGATEVQLLPTQIENGNYAVWSNRGDQSNMRMTRIFDLGNAQAPVLLTYKTWFEIEADYDYLYVEVSEDGENWTILETPSGTSADPAGNNYGWGYSGLSGGWIDEEVDLSEYAGEEIWLRFEYVTDGAVNGNGWLVDDITIPAIAYREDFENGVGGWELEGFVRSDNQLSQTFQVSLIRLGDEISVHRIELDQANRALIPHVLNNQSNDDVILVVSGTNRYTRQPARYSFQMIGMD
jgi:bacillopeptidase F (M6 metalloprotease family)